MQDNGQWHFELGPDTDVVCEEEGRVAVFDNLKLSMNPTSKHFQDKKPTIGIKNIFEKYIKWVFLTIFKAAKSANPDMEYFRVRKDHSKYPRLEGEG
jgi:hypothetical protein